MTESSYINSLAYRHILPTIKTLPATLPESSYEIREPRTGVADQVSYFRMTCSKGVGSKLMRLGARARGYLMGWWIEGCGVLLVFDHSCMV